ncbi:hypothetical protein NDN16_17610 [Aureimonas altamirensis]|uniref:hypothetical protein n=1 Tax=Aureimonas altamirensis TaxID=370622 RepID=UPI002036A53E|nr:hypothetical protein [Aureimonas altamirensis]MCM2505487.1 hypothetical protein [Aureimonas altamirensis]
MYNRFGSFNPFGMIFALGRDVASSEQGVAPVRAHTAEACAGLTGAEGIDTPVADRVRAGSGGQALVPGKVRLKDCKRARPLVLRANVGDTLEITVTNLLRPRLPGLTRDFCRQGNPAFAVQPGAPTAPYAYLCAGDGEHDPLGAEIADPEAAPEPPEPPEGGLNYDWPATRNLSFVIPGLELAEGSHPACRGLDAVTPGGSFVCRYAIEREGTHLFSSFAAPSGGEGDAGSAIHGLFGALIVEPEGSRWYRSQVTQTAFDAVWGKDAGRGNGARIASFDYEASVAGVPVLNLLQEGAGGFRIVHGDLNAVVVPPQDAPHVAGGLDETAMYDGAGKAYREFTVIFHDELKTYYSRNFKELEDYSQFSGVGDGFAINYGASGMGSLLLANRKGMGPAADCVECVYEEFFLQSWANGDPALRESFPDDPSNVHHSYLNDRVVFRNFHVGKETHVFHLHAHQWLAGDGTMASNQEYGSYLDSQTIGPQQGMTYKIYNPAAAYRRSLDGAGAQARERLGWWSALGSGNRNRTPGDSIFHCHLYPHFAQGMWALWRVHDVIEDGSRRLPDGQAHEGLSLRLGDVGPARRGTDIATGAPGPGTPVPGLVPLPEYALPPLPTYGQKGFPGYPFYIDAEPGHRVSQPPMDMARAADGTAMDGGLPRHIVKSGERSMTGKPVAELVADIGKEAAGKLLVRRALALADFSVHIDKAFIETKAPDGTPLERRAMAFHSGGEGVDEMPLLSDARGNPMTAVEGTYASLRIGRQAGAAPAQLAPTASVADLDPDPTEDQLAALAGNAPFLVNGAPPKAGAPFADPCGGPRVLSHYAPPLSPGALLDNGALRQIPDRLTLDPAANLFQPDPMLAGFRRYEASVVELDLVVNKAGWHDPQSRINVLTAEVDTFKNKVRGDAEPFFFRAHSGDCIEFRHTNETPYNLERDDFQVKTPTDTIGQHIHLVKFDVMAADGSGNGWNYEDGTLAPGAIHERICAAVKASGQGAVDAMGIRMLDRQCTDDAHAMEAAFVGAHLDPRRDRYQTTVQRWFADPFTAAYHEQKPGQDARTVWHDRTLRTVFTHDHFGPSSIQQHGFYNALLVEPAGVGPDRSVWRSAWFDSHSGAPLARAGLAGSDADSSAGPDTRVPPSGAVGAIASIIANEPAPSFSDAQKQLNASALESGIDERIRHRDTREAALAIADFALIYDPTGERQDGKGLGRLVRQADCTIDGACHEPVQGLADAARQRQLQSGAAGPLRFTPEAGGGAVTMDTLVAADRDALAAATTAWHDAHGQPVYPPFRPEAISQTHHDPYLVNYKHEPFPLRLGDRPGTGPDDRCPAGEMVLPAVAPGDGISELKPGAAGRIDGVFRSDLHGDPCTPLIEAYENDPVQVRLIQGAQEVQHTFTVDGVAWPRNVDEAYRHAGLDRLTRREILKQSINPWAMVHAQEVGISEHFEASLTARLAGASTALPFINAPSPAGTQAATERGSADGLYHFGTMDALWNGAWGLTRTHEKMKGDAQAPLDQLPLAPLARLSQAPSGPFSRNVASLCPAGAPLVYAYAMALTLRDYADGTLAGAGAWPGAATGGAVYRRWGNGQEGLFYDLNNGVYDPDALVLVHVDPSEVKVLDTPARLGVDTARFRARVNRQWVRFGVEPYVLRVNAGDCIRWTVFNGLPATMHDAPGDAILPKIARLNVDERDESANGRVAPTPHLALMPALPRLVDARRESYPFGHNITADPALLASKEASLAPGDVGQGTTGLTATWLYAGTRIGSVAHDEEAILRAKALQLKADSETTGQWPNLPKDLDFCRFRPNAALGALTLPDGRTVSSVETCSLAPYAFGATPIKSVSDPIGHASHGLVGSILVETAGTVIPQTEQFGESSTMPWDPPCIADASAEDDLGMLADPPTEWDFEPRTPESAPVHCVRAGFAGPASTPDDSVLMRPAAALQAMRLPDDAAVNRALAGITLARVPDAPLAELPQAALEPVHENILFYQDGLNLWHWNRGFGTPRPVGDCHVCDDSYDRGEKAIGYRSAPLFTRIAPLGNPLRYTRERQEWIDGGGSGPLRPSGDDDASPGNLNAVIMPRRLFDPAFIGVSTPFLKGRAGERMDTYVLLPQGRARQRSFVLAGHAYDEFGRHGYGSGHSALVAPGNVVSAESRPGVAGCSMYRDGPGPMWAGGAWGLVDILPAGGNALEPTCAPPR